MTYRRHDAGPRNRRKAHHHAGCLGDELADIESKLIDLLDCVRYARGRGFRFTKRLEIEVRADEEALAVEERE